MEKVIAEYFGQQFELTLTEKRESHYMGFLQWDDENRRRYYMTIELHEEDNDSWYLDNNGHRIPDEELFEKSPWTIIEDGQRKKAVKRLSKESGEVWFDMEPWFRIGNEYNKT